MQRLQIFAVLLFALSKGVLEGWTQDAMSAHEARVNRFDSSAVWRRGRKSDIIMFICSNISLLRTTSQRQHQPNFERNRDR